MTKVVQPAEAFQKLLEELTQKAEDKVSINSEDVNMSFNIIQTDALIQILEHLKYLHRHIMQQEQRIIQ